MPTVGRYCKAYPIRRLREFEGWKERAANARSTTEESGPRLLAEDTFLYIQESYVVTDGIYVDQNVIFDEVDDAWKRFCRETLGFRPPRFDEGSDNAPGEGDPNGGATGEGSA